MKLTMFSVIMTKSSSAGCLHVFSYIFPFIYIWKSPENFNLCLFCDITFCKQCWKQFSCKSYILKSLRSSSLLYERRSSVLDLWWFCEMLENWLGNETEFRILNRILCKTLFYKVYKFTDLISVNRFNSHTVYKSYLS